MIQKLMSSRIAISARPKSEPSNGSYDVEPNESDAGADYDSIVNELLDGLEKEIDEIIGSYVSDDEEEP